jgi:hypothetical protein
MGRAWGTLGIFVVSLTCTASLCAALPYRLSYYCPPELVEGKGTLIRKQNSKLFVTKTTARLRQALTDSINGVQVSW